MTHSLLSMVVQDERVNRVLENLRASVRKDGNLALSRGDTDYIKQRFQEGIQLGEKGLHEISFDIIRDLADLNDATATLIVWGRCPKKEHTEINKTYTAIQLAQVLTAKYMDSIIAWSHSPVCKICKQKNVTIASFNQYRFGRDYPSGLKIMLTRIKTTSNICYKIADMVFDIDRMFKHDKIINQYTQTLMDVYGVKIAFQSKENLYSAIDYFRNRPDLSILDEKNYLEENRKKSGYEAYKIAFKAKDQIFEAQLQTMQMLEVERSHLKASHTTYKEKQMEDRRKLGPKYQHLYDLLIQAFSPEDVAQDI